MTESSESYGMRADCTMVIEAGRIEWLGEEVDMPPKYRNSPLEDVEGRLITPGLIDCHSHLVFGGNRAAEFEQRLNGASYEEVARAGGGIISTVKATRDTSVEGLVQDALPRLDAVIAEGVTTLEIKSGYGLNHETELNMLRAARQLADHRNICIKTSFLGAHAIPPEFNGAPDQYIDEICIPALRAAHSEGLVDAVDGFCEGIAFNIAQIGRVFQVASELGLPVKLHSDQLSNIGGTRLAASFNALSVDHLEYTSESDAAVMARAGSVAVILPGAYYTLRETRQPPIEAFRRHEVPMAIATDCNPGSSPMTSILLAMNMGCTLFRMTPEEVLAGVTRNAAQALGLKDRGTIDVGNRADLAIWDVTHPAELAYRIGFNPLYKRITGGVS